MDGPTHLVSRQIITGRVPSHRRPTAAGLVIKCVLVIGLGGILSTPVAATTPLPPRYIEEAKSIRLLPTRFEQVKLPLREGEITAILPIGEVLWIGTTNGLFLFDGISSARPQPREGSVPILYVKSLLALKDNTVLVGTINGSIWRASRDRLENLFDSHDRDEFDFVRASDGEIYVAESFGRLRPEQVRLLVEGQELRLLPGAFTRLADSNQYVYAATDSGNIVQFDVSHPETDLARMPARGISNSLKQYPRRLQADKRGLLWITTDAGIEAIDSTSGASAVIADGNCGGVGESRFGQVWLACMGRLAEFDGSWRTWLVDPAFGRGSTVIADEAGNLWVGGNGLWRAFQYARTLSTDDSARRVARAGSDAIWTISSSGAISLLQLSNLSSRLVLPPASEPATLTVDSGGRVFAVHERALWRLEDLAMIAHLPDGAGDVAVAIGAPGVFVAERANDGRVWRLTDGQFMAETVTIRAESGSGAACMGVDRLGRVWISSATQLFVRLPTGEWLTSAAIPYAPETKLNRWGTFWVDSAGNPFIFGPWGYTIAPDVQGDRVTTARMSPQGHDQPWLATSAIPNRPFGLVLGTDNGLFAFGDGQFRALGVEDTRLRSPILSLASLDESKFVAATQLGLVEVDMSLPAPTLEISSVPASIQQRLLRISARAPGLAGPPQRTYTLIVSSPVDQTSLKQVSADGNFVLDELRDATLYKLVASVTDGLGVSGPRVDRAFRVSVPLVDKRWFGPVLAGIVFVLVGSILLSARLSALTLRTLGRKRWQLAIGTCDLTLEVRLSQSEVLFSAVAQSRQTTTRMEERVPKQVLSGLFPASDVETSLRQAVSSGWEGLPANFQFAIQTFPNKHIVLQIDDELIQCLWELTGPTDTARLGLRAYVSRVVTTDRAFARDKLAASRLKVLIVAPQYRGSSVLRTQEEELRLVLRRFQRAGAAVTVLNGHVKAQSFSGAVRDTHILHFVGHATHDPFVPDRSALEFTDGPMTATDLSGIVKEGVGPSLVFINACSSGAEEPWSDGSNDLYGVASPFIRSGAFFVGARWPVHEIFATEFADIFYRSLLPSFGFRTWARWLAGRIIEGETLGTALATGRLALTRGPATLATWSAYVAYGDPTAKLVLR